MTSSIREVRCVHTTEVMGHAGGGSLSSSMGGGGGSAGGGGVLGGGGGTSAGGGGGALGGGNVGTSSPALDCTFSIIHGEDFSSLDLIAPSAEEANIWVTGLNALLGSQCESFFLFVRLDIVPSVVGNAHSIQRLSNDNCC